jgi:hypothetical protein
MPKNTTKFFEQIASKYLTKIDIENYIKKITNNHDLTKLQILKCDFQLFIDLYRGELEDEISSEMIEEKIKHYENLNIEIPIKYYDAVFDKDTGEMLFESGKEIDLEKIFFPFEMFSLNQVNFYIDNLIKEHENPTVIEPIKSNKNLLFDGKPLNLLERYQIANKVLDIENKINTLNITKDKKNELLSYILDCNIDNAKKLLNGNYDAKPRNLKSYFKDLDLTE